MGQAKRRGSFEQRKAEAIKCEEIASAEREEKRKQDRILRNQIEQRKPSQKLRRSQLERLALIVTLTNISAV